MVSGKMMFTTDWARSKIMMACIMKDNLPMVNVMDQVRRLIRTETFTKEALRMIRSKAKE